MSTVRVRPADLINDFTEAKPHETKDRKAAKTLSFLQKFSADSTLHGIRYLFESESFILRKVLWLLVIFACTGFCIQQFHSRITRFLSDDQSVDVEIVYVNELEFPQVTICNNNLFKSTNVGSTGAYMTIQKFFSSTDYGDAKFIKELEDIDNAQFQYTGSYINLTEESILSRHAMETMLIGCRFHGIPCNASDFTMILTDYGPCYQFTFNGGPLVVNNAGAGTGLTLTLSAEQYAYMNGPRFSAGFQLSIQDPAEVPKIEGRAINIPIGGEIFIGLDLSKVQLIPPPKGDCSSKVLKYYPKYSVSACQMECLTEYVVSHCNCKNNFMPGNASLCRLPVYFDCSYPFSKNYSLSQEAKDCVCPPSCEESIYYPLLTFSPLSDFVAKFFAATLVDDALFTEYVKALGIYEFYYSPEQNNKDLAAIYKFSPSLVDFAQSIAPLYSNLVSISQLLDGIVKVTSTQHSPSSSNLMNLALSLKAPVNDFIELVQSVNPGYFYGQMALSNDNLPRVLTEQLGLNGRFLFFNSYRKDVVDSNNGTTLLSLQSNLTVITGNIENNIRQMIQTAIASDLSATIPALAPMISNMSDTFLLLVTSNALADAALQRLVSNGLEDINQYAIQNVPPLSSLKFDPPFIRSNFMKVEVFFKDMRYESIEKKMSDSVTSLICDIGGTFGLCLGASIMSIYEFIDFAICYIRLRFA